MPGLVPSSQMKEPQCLSHILSHPSSACDLFSPWRPCLPNAGPWGSATSSCRPQLQLSTLRRRQGVPSAAVTPGGLLLLLIPGLLKYPMGHLEHSGHPHTGHCLRPTQLPASHQAVLRHTLGALPRDPSVMGHEPLLLPLPISLQPPHLVPSPWVARVRGTLPSQPWMVTLLPPRKP